MPHAWHLYARILPEGREAIARRRLRAAKAGGLSPETVDPPAAADRTRRRFDATKRWGAQMSDAFDRFRYSFFEDPTSARDGLDISSLRAIEDYERANAERLLLAFLPDARAVIGLGVLRSVKAEPELSRLFETERKQQVDARKDPAMQPGGSNEWYPSAMLYLAQALWRIRPEPRWPQAVIEVLSSARDWVFRHEAVLVLAGVGEPIAVEALVNALDDGEPLVRHGAARALLTLHGLPADFTDPQAVTIRIMSRDAARRETARLEILAVIAGRAVVRE
jgi:hypothetical protein